MSLKYFFIVLIATFSTSAQVSKVGYSAKDDATLLFYKVKGIDTVKIPGNWEHDKRDLATSVYLTNAYNQIGLYIDTKNKKIKAATSQAESLKIYVGQKTKKLKGTWEFELLGTDNETYQLYKIKSLRHPDGGQIALLGTRGNFVYNIVCYGTIDDNIKSDFLIRLYKNTKP